MITIIMIIMMHARTCIEVNSWTFCMRSSKSRGYDETGEAVPPWRVDVGKHSLKHDTQAQYGE